MSVVDRSLQRALAAIAAVPVPFDEPCPVAGDARPFSRFTSTAQPPADAAPAWYAYPTSAGRWYVAPRAALEAQAVHLGDMQLFRFTLEHHAAMMPRWWRPEHRETYRDKRDGSYAPAEWVTQGCTPFDSLAHHYERITADLATGEERVLPPR